MTVNIVGSLLMGLIAEYFAQRSHLPQSARLFLTTGILGGFTTFSAFSLDAALMIEKGRTTAAFAYVAVSVLGSIGALFLALSIVRIALR